MGLNQLRISQRFFITSLDRLRVVSEHLHRSIFYRTADLGHIIRSAVTHSALAHTRRFIYVICPKVTWCLCMASLSG
uniref:Uncharacterized protein n=1 Tax=Theileria lestoquardi TaxID=77054 RepID=Q208T2_THELE|nr:unknown [Theileria lestoquardi]ABD64139.1 unknown [Theileria lestoquardi]